MLIKDRIWIAYVCMAIGLFYATFLVFNSGKTQHITSADWPLFGSSDTALGKEGIDSSSSSQAPEWNDATTSPTSSHGSPTLAIATFLTGQADDDTYFNLTRLLAYQLLQVPETRIQNPDIGFVVLCGTKLPEAKREILRKDGATVIPLEDVTLPSWIHSSEPRWSEQFTKLRVFEQTQYSRVLYMDADYMIMHRMDEIFREPIITQLTPTLFIRKKEIKQDEGPLPKQWLFAGRSENGGQGGFDHFVPPIQTNYANGGFFMVAPQQEMYDHLMNLMQIEGRFDTHFMEQDMLNYVFRRDGPMPWRELDWKWSSNFANQRDVDGGVHALHGKFWAEGPEVVRKKFRELVRRMEERDAEREKGVKR